MDLVSASGKSGGPLGENPFPEGTSLHQILAEINLWAKEHLALFQAEMLKSRPSEEASTNELMDYALKVIAGSFEIWARAFSRNVALTDKTASLFEQLLDELEPAMVANISGFLPGGFDTSEIRRLLYQRKQYLLGRMLRKVRKHKEANRAKAVELPEEEPRKLPQPTGDVAEPGVPTSRKRGPEPDYETALRVAEIVERVAGDGKWRPKLEEICLELGEGAIPCPKTWKKRGHRNWFDALSERPLVEKAIAHHLKLAKRYEKTFS